MPPFIDRQLADDGRMERTIAPGLQPTRAEAPLQDIVAVSMLDRRVLRNGVDGAPWRQQPRRGGLARAVGTAGRAGRSAGDAVTGAADALS